MEGLIETNNFFSNKSCFLISEIDKWTIFNYFHFRLRDIIFIILIFILKNYKFIIKYIPYYIRNNLYFIYLINFIIKILEEIFYLFII